MTRETKIGLLVGLAFIIVIGILLSDHMTSTTDPPKAPLSVAGANVRESVTSPTSAQNATAAATPPSVVAPAQSVLTQQEVGPAAQAQRPPVGTLPVQTIQVGPGAPQGQSPITIQQTAQGPGAAQPPVSLPQAPPQSGDSPVTVAPQNGQRRGVAHPLQGVANQHGEEIVVIDPAAPGNSNPPVPMAPMAPLREYKAQSGDSLSRMASRFLGANTKANRDAIIRVNASLQQNPDKIIEGRTYFIPAASTAAANIAAVKPASPVGAGDTTRPAQPEAAVPSGFTWYTVKENDNLWRIAADQLGTGTAARQIKDLNADVLKGNDNLQVGMRLRIPPRPVASVE